MLYSRGGFFELTRKKSKNEEVLAEHVLLQVPASRFKDGRNSERKLKMFQAQRKHPRGVSLTYLRYRRPPRLSGREHGNSPFLSGNRSGTCCLMFILSNQNNQMEEVFP